MSLFKNITAVFQSPSSHLISAQPFPDRPRPMLCRSVQMEPGPITLHAH